MKGSYFIFLFSLASILILLLFFYAFEKEVVDYVEKDKTNTNLLQYDDAFVSKLLNENERLDNGHIKVKSLCYKCHVISESKANHSVSSNTYFNKTINMINQGNSKGMPSYKHRLQKSDIEDIAAFLTKIKDDFSLMQSK